MLLFRKKCMEVEKTVRFSNNDLDDMTKIVKTLEDSNVLMKGITETLKNDIKNEAFNTNVPWYFSSTFIDWKRNVQSW